MRSSVPPNLSGKVALVTGVGRVGQIGHAVARGLGRAGAKLLLADVNAVGLADRVNEFSTDGIAAKASAGNLTKPEAARPANAPAPATFAGLTRELALEYRDACIRVNAVAPATVRTADNVAQMGDNQALVELADVVNTVLFLASDEASAITGQIVPITGKAY